MIFSRTWFGRLSLALYMVLAIVAVAISASADDSAQGASDAETYKPKTKAELRRVLTRIQYRVTQEEDTEPAFRNTYWDNKREGTYQCIVCDLAVFDSTTKFKSGTGWPSFWKPLAPEAVGTKTDWKMLYPRTEVHCSRCEAHLGHVFEDGPPPTGLRYCLNSAALKFVAADKKTSEEAK